MSDAHHGNKSRWLRGADKKSARTKNCKALAEMLGSELVSEVSPDDIVAFRKGLVDAGYKANTELNALRAVRSFSNWCIATERCQGRART